MLATLLIPIAMFVGQVKFVGQDHWTEFTFDECDSIRTWPKCLTEVKPCAIVSQ